MFYAQRGTFVPASSYPLAKGELELNLIELIKSQLAQSVNEVVAVDVSEPEPNGKFLMIYICNFHFLSHLLLNYIFKLHWNLNTMVVCQVNSL